MSISDEEFEFIKDFLENINKIEIIHLMNKDPSLTLSEATKLHAKNMEELDKSFQITDED